jgi:hypothetical protein
MTRWPLFAFVLLAGCVDVDPDGGGGGGGGGGKSDNPDAITHVTTAWEAPVGSGGSAVINNVMTLSSGDLLATSYSPHWVRRFSPSGQSNAPAIPTGVHHENALYTSSDFHPSHQVWEVSAHELVAVAGGGAMFQLRGYTADGLLNPVFGTAGVVLLTDPATPFNTPVAIEYDTAHDRFVALVVRTRLASGPSEIEVQALDAHTGVRTSAGTFTLPPWEDPRSSNLGRLHELIAQPDGSFLVLASNTFYVPSEPGVTDRPVTRWSMFHLVAGAAPTQISLTVSDYSTHIAAFTRLANGRFDLYLNGGIDYTEDDNKLARFSVDSDLAPHMDDLGPAVFLDPGCQAATASPTMFVYGHAPNRSTMPMEFTAYPKGGEPHTFTSDKVQRCLLDLSLGASGQLYAGTWDTSGPVWTALLTALVPD